jgi:hypothetical protein
MSKNRKKGRQSDLYTALPESGTERVLSTMLYHVYMLWKYTIAVLHALLLRPQLGHFHLTVKTWYIVFYMFIPPGSSEMLHKTKFHKLKVLTYKKLGLLGPLTH